MQSRLLAGGIRVTPVNFSC
uniref:Uncharacterized protein n=1 Tax=Arundo donax TaxID=35708 RepID=A0A0A9GA54_ARUDO